MVKLPRNSKSERKASVNSAICWSGTPTTVGEICLSSPTTITLSFIRAGHSVRFEPVLARQRTGHSKIRFARDGVKFFVIILKIVTLFSPLRVFLPISLASFSIGAAYAVWTIATQSHVTNSSVLLIMLAVIVFLVGLVSEQISAMRFESRQ